MSRQPALIRKQFRPSLILQGGLEVFGSGTGIARDMDETVKSTILLTYDLPPSNRINPHPGRILPQKTLVLRPQNIRFGKFP